MRDKADILKESDNWKSKTPVWDTTASIHEHLTIEVLIDIRDQLTALSTVLCHIEKIWFRPR